MAGSATTPNDFIIVSNRLPVDATVGEGGETTWRPSPGGLVAALAPVIDGKTATWVGWPGKADIDVDPFQQGMTRYLPIALSEQELTEYYEGFSNSTLWPLYHDAIVAPEFHQAWWDTYRSVNARFAEATARAATPGALVWVHDYQLQLVPQMLRELRPDLNIGYFHHVPFPEASLFAELPWQADVLRGLLGADVIGVQRQSDATHLGEAISQVLGLLVNQSVLSLPAAVSAQSPREVLVRAFPISLDMSGIEKLARDPAVAARAAEIRRELGEPDHLFLGVDRLDYTKGIGERLQAFGELLSEGKLDAHSSVFVQLASPTRQGVASYRALREKIEAQVNSINSQWESEERPPVVYRPETIDRAEMMAMYVAADVMVVTPLRDGMNLVAKEFVAARTDEQGVLVLSENAGAADEFHEALLVDPRDDEAMKAALMTAATMPEKQQQQRMRALRETLRANDVTHWAQYFLQAMASHRTREGNVG